MRVIHVVLGKANPDRMNGVNQVVHHLATEQVERGDEVEVWGITADPEAETPRRVYLLRLFHPFVARVVPPRALLDALSEVEPDTVFHLHGSFIPELASLAAVLRSRGRRYFVTPHGALSPAAMRKNALLKRAYFSLLEEPLLSRAAGVHLVGESEWLHFRELLPGARGFLIPNGQHLSEVAFEGAPAQAPARPVFGFCGRLDWEYKGIDLLVEGFSIHKANGGGGLLWLVGDGRDRRRTRDLVEARGLSQSVTLFGTLFGSEKLRHLAGMDAFFHPSRSEGFPMGALEAAALGRALVVSRSTNLGDYVLRHGAGRVLPENTPSNIAQAMAWVERARLDGSLERAGRGAVEMIQRQLNWARVARLLADEYGRA